MKIPLSKVGVVGPIVATVVSDLAVAATRAEAVAKAQTAKVLPGEEAGTSALFASRPNGDGDGDQLTGEYELEVVVEISPLSVRTGLTDDRSPLASVSGSAHPGSTGDWTASRGLGGARPDLGIRQAPRRPGATHHIDDLRLVATTH